jgi:SAM-dependent methyltransferase
MNGASNATPKTWHYGVVAQWWAEFNQDGPEIAYYQKLIQRFGEPALDVGCGTGRLLLPYLAAGLDVDGCDISPDMLAWCRKRAESQNLTPTLYTQAMHELDLPRRYRTLVVCGSFGLGGNRDNGSEALRRFYRHLVPGGVLLLENYVPWANPNTWHYFLTEKRQQLPEPLAAPHEPRPASDGSALCLRARVIALDPLEQIISYAMRARRFRDGELEADEEHTLVESFYFKNELLLMLEQVGFHDIRIQADHSDREPNPDSKVLVFIARK